MNNKQLLAVLSLFLCNFVQSSDIFNAIASKNKKSIQKWLKSERDIDAVNEHGQSMLIKAVQYKNRDLVGRLLRLGAKVNIVDNFGQTALDYAVESGNKTVVKMLLGVNAMVTTESNMVRCKQLITKSTGFGRIFAAFGLGAIGVVSAFVFGLGVLATCIVFGCGGNAASFLGATVCLGAVSGVALYGSVKIGQSNNNSIVHDVEIIPSVV